MKKIGLKQIDGKHKNLALMKLSTHFKNQGYEVTTSDFSQTEQIWVSVVFPENYPVAVGFSKMFANSKVIIGGTGKTLSPFGVLPHEVEHCKPDYNLFGCNYSVGFTSRGCFRKCPFCIVWQKEGTEVIEWSPFEEFVDDRFSHIVLYDGQFLGSPKAFKKLKWLRDTGLSVNFSQGLDLRLITEETAGLLADIKCKNYHNTTKQYYFAWDFIKDEKFIFKGMDLLRNAGIRPYNMMIYILCGFNTTFAEDMKRIQKIIDYGAQPYLMRYNDSKDYLMKKLQRWTNRRFYKYCAFEDFTSYIRDYPNRERE